MERQFDFKRLKEWQRGRRGDHLELALPLPKSISGLVLRWCPSEGCKPRRFQLGDTTDHRPGTCDTSKMRRTPGSAGCTCPYCGTDGDDDSFIAPEDLEAAKDQIAWAVGEDVGDWAEQMAKDFNQAVGGKGNFLGLSMSISRPRKPQPRPWREDLLRSMTCPLCTRSYGVYAIGFFCPDCGGANLAAHFSREVALVLAQLDIGENIATEGERELAYRLLGNANEDVVTAFEAYLKAAFRFVTNARLVAEELANLDQDLKGNPFQNLDRAISLYEHLGVALTAGLSSGDCELLNRSFKKRHVVGHNVSLMDERYVAQVGGGSVGETVSLVADEVEQFVGLCLEVVTTVERQCAEFHPSA